MESCRDSHGESQGLFMEKSQGLFMESCRDSHGEERGGSVGASGGRRARPADLTVRRPPRLEFSVSVLALRARSTTKRRLQSPTLPPLGAPKSRSHRPLEPNPGPACAPKHTTARSTGRANVPDTARSLPDSPPERSAAVLSPPHRPRERSRYGPPTTRLTPGTLRGSPFSTPPAARTLQSSPAASGFDKRPFQVRSASDLLRKGPYPERLGRESPRGHAAPHGFRERPASQKAVPGTARPRVASRTRCPAYVPRATRCGTQTGPERTRGESLQSCSTATTG
jgi:hypothetical protein